MTFTEQSAAAEMQRASLKVEAFGREIDRINTGIRKRKRYRDGKAYDEKRSNTLHHPGRRHKCWHDNRCNLKQKPCNDGIGGGRSYNVSALQFGENTHRAACRLDT